MTNGVSNGVSNGVTNAAPSRPVYRDTDVGVSPTPVLDNEVPLRCEDRARYLAARQLEHLDHLALIGHPTRFEGKTRDVVRTVLFLTARDELER